MPVYKYRHVSEMEGRAWREPEDPGLFRAIRATWDFARRTTQPHFPPGVYKHPSIGSAEALRETWERANFESFRARRARGQRTEPIP
jgi:hypothetical protein